MNVRRAIAASGSPAAGGARVPGRRRGSTGRGRRPGGNGEEGAWTLPRRLRPTRPPACPAGSRPPVAAPGRWWGRGPAGGRGAPARAGQRPADPAGRRRRPGGDPLPLADRLGAGACPAGWAPPGRRAGDRGRRPGRLEGGRRAAGRWARGPGAGHGRGPADDPPAPRGGTLPRSQPQRQDARRRQRKATARPGRRRVTGRPTMYGSGRAGWASARMWPPGWPRSHGRDRLMLGRAVSCPASFIETLGRQFDTAR
jgi:hypothetical protein